MTEAAKAGSSGDMTKAKQFACQAEQQAKIAATPRRLSTN
jgi:hypothetical protein